LTSPAHPGPAELLEAYEGFLVRQGRAPGTRTKYVHGVGVFLEWAGDRISGEMALVDIDLFLSTWETEWERATGRRPSRATVRGRISALRSFFTYLERGGLLRNADGLPAKNPMIGVVAPAVEQRPNDFLRPVEDNALLECGSPAVERMVVWLLRWTGLRVSEACALRLEDIDLTPGRQNVLVRRSKTAAGMRTIPLVPCLVPEIEGWMATLGLRGPVSPQAHFLATATGSAFKPTFIWRLVKRAGARAHVRPVECLCGSRLRTRHARGCPRTTTGENVSEITPQTLRRTFGSYLVNKGLRLEVVSRLLGHSSTVVTERAYAELLGSTVRDELFAILDTAA
jgi:integrase